LLAPEYPTEGKARALNHQKQRQQHYYDLHTRPLKPLVPGESVRMRLPGEKVWSPGICAGLVGPRSYEVRVGDRTFVRNRRHLIKSKDVVVEDTPEMEEPMSAESPVTSPAKESDPPPVEAVPTPQASGPAPGHKEPTSTPAGPMENALTTWVTTYSTRHFNCTHVHFQANFA